MSELKRIFAIFIVITVVFSCGGVKSVFAYNMEDGTETLTTEEIQAVANMKGKPSVLARAALVYDRKYKKILYEKNINQKMPNASTTKILTAIVAYENGNMNDVVVVSERAASIGGSTINLRKGNKVLLGDLIKGLLICSGNDAAIAIAEHISGSVEDFCELMNKRARELGATNTNFTTPHGLDNDNHYTTASDLLIFADYLLNIDYLANVVNTKNTVIKIDNYEKPIHTTNEMLSIYDEANGLKTGYTSKAGRCLVTSMTRNGRQTISIVLGCDTKKQRTRESIQLLNYAYNNFEEVDVYENIKKSFEVTIHKSKNKNYEIDIAGNKMMLLPLGSKDLLTYSYNMRREMTAPVKKGEVIGTIVIKSQDEIIDVVTVKMPREIKRKGILDYFEKIIVNQLKYIIINV